MQLARGWASWRRPQLPEADQKEPGVSPDRPALGWALIPGSRATVGAPGVTLVQRLPFFFPVKQPGSWGRAGFQQCVCLGLPIPTGPATAFSFGIPRPVRD